MTDGPENITRMGLRASTGLGGRAWVASALAFGLLWSATPSALAQTVTVSCAEMNAANADGAWAQAATGYSIGVGINETTGVLNVQNQTLDLPPNGVICVSGVTSSTGTLTFRRNAANTPVYLLVEGDFTLSLGAHTIDVSGGNESQRYAIGMDRTGGLGGPGGSDGGSCDFTRIADLDRRVGEGIGPGGGLTSTYGTDAIGPGGGGASPIADGGPGFSEVANNRWGGAGGSSYAQWNHTMLHGGSGGACGAAGVSPTVSQVNAGGGGGGVLVIGAGGTITVNGTLMARGGTSTTWGGGGGGGVIRLVADTITGSGHLRVEGSAAMTNCGGTSIRGGCGGHGLVRVEAPDGGASGTLLNNVTPAESLRFGVPQAIVPPFRPTLDITAVTASFDGTPQVVTPLQLNPTEHVHWSAGVFLEAPAPPQTITVTLSSNNVPHTANVWVRMNVLRWTGNNQESVAPSLVVSATTTGQGSGSLTWVVNHTVPAGMELGTIEAWVENICIPDSAGCP